MERIQKIIANSGYASRRKAEELIKQGRVTVNGEIVRELGQKASYADTIMIDGEALKKEDKEYILLYKPRDVVTTSSDDKHRKTVIDLVETPKRVYPVGRLDYDTSGVLLLTNDGELTNLLTHPSSNIEKVYLVKIDEAVNPHVLKKLETRVIIDGKKTAPAKVKVKKIDKKKNKSLIYLTIHEGRNHQVKKMFEAIGYKVAKLKREKFAGLDLHSLKSGEWRRLSVHEVKVLYSLVKKN